MDGMVMDELVVEEERFNPLLNRVELMCIIKGMNGMLKRQDAAKLIVECRGYAGRFIVPVNMRGEKGKRDLRCLFYIYEDEGTARSQLPRYIIARLTGEKVEKGGKKKGEGDKGKEGG
ncbi:putative 30S ribosomal protein S24e (fragment) [Candidatus Nitrosocaldus cavascurensis]|jgi:ribosomal protein S24E|uniref:Putative 30S ribosomal protein S24e n=2 Tax=Candidatus Nitrosocaldaceae TaxID=1968910 RepID=A0A2K5ARX4_9ARCH